MASQLDFGKFKRLVEARFKQMQKDSQYLFASKADPAVLYETYLNSFPQGTNPIFRERSEHDCSACRSFIRQAGGVLAIIDNKLVSIWDVVTDDDYQPVADALSTLSKNAGIDSIFIHYVPVIGTDFHVETINGSQIKWEHFHQRLDAKFVSPKDDIGPRVGQARNNYETLKRSLTEITPESVSIVRDLIAQNALYRGAEHSSKIDELAKAQREYQKASNPELFIWTKSLVLGPASAYRNTVIGTLLTDLSEGVDLETAVGRFEAKVAPQNYKRTTALITKKMIQEAEAKVQELNLEQSLHRRFATIDDLNINNVLFASRQSAQLMGAFDQLAAKTADTVPALDKLTVIPIQQFIDEVIPTASKIEVFLEGRHQSNLVSLIAPVYNDAPNILKWGNNFSWSYHGEVTDSIKERVKAAGGNVAGFMRVSLSWFNYDDLDLHIHEPTGGRINFRNKRSLDTGGVLDVDMNAGVSTTREPVENVIWVDPKRMVPGKYQVVVNCWALRETNNRGYTIQMENEGRVWEFSSAKSPASSHSDTVATFTVDKDRNVTVNGTTNPSFRAQELWGLTTGKYVEVTSIMYSPNHWVGENVGNKHVFFMLKDCINPESARGFYNEFLKNELNPHRKVFEHLGSLMKTLQTDQQLSGLGFSTTKPDHLICKVTGTFTRTVKVTF